MPPNDFDVAVAASRAAVQAMGRGDPKAEGRHYRPAMACSVSLHE